MLKRFFLILTKSIIFLSIISCSFSSKESKLMLGFQDLLNFDIGEKKEVLKLSPKDYLEWYNENINKFFINIDTLGFNYKLEYRPSELEAIKLSHSDQDLDSIFALKNNNYYFIVSTIATQEKSREVLNDFAKGNEMNFYMQKAFRLVCGGDSVICSQFLPIRETLSINGSIAYFLAFEKKQFKFSDLYRSKLLFHDLYLTDNVYTMEFNDSFYQQMPLLITNKKL